MKYNRGTTHQHFIRIAGVAFVFGLSIFLSVGLSIWPANFLSICPLTYLDAAFAADKPTVWKATDQALLRVNDRAVKVWNVYKEGKKLNPLLLEIGTRYLLIDSRKHEIFEVDSAKIAHNGADLTWNPADHAAAPLETSDWTVRDVGLAYKINVRLVAEAMTLDLQLPHPLDIRGVY